jgi:hypothetical protein
MMGPDWHQLHWGTCSSIHACLTAVSFPLAMPSIVVTFLPTTWLTGVIHEWVGFRSTSTRHTAHSPMPQPNFVPVSFGLSRSAHNKG